MIDRLIHIHALVCTRTETVRRAVIEEELEDRETKPYETQGLAENENFLELQRNQVFFLLRPLFRAVAILIVGHGRPTGHIEITKAMIEEALGLPFYVICTGVTEGLSAPIPLEEISDGVPESDIVRAPDGTLRAVKTTLQVTFDFLQRLQQREDAAFGEKPDLVDSTRNFRAGYLETPERMMGSAGEFGWRGDRNLLPEGPSAGWVPDGLVVFWAPDIPVAGSGGEHQYPRGV